MSLLHNEGITLENPYSAYPPMQKNPSFFQNKSSRILFKVTSIFDVTVDKDLNKKLSNKQIKCSK